MDRISATASEIYDFVNQTMSLRHAATTATGMALLAYFLEKGQRVPPSSRSLKKVRIPSIHRQRTQSRSLRCLPPLSSSRPMNGIRKRSSGDVRYMRSASTHEPLGETRPLHSAEIVKYRRSDGPCFPIRWPRFHPKNPKFAGFLTAVTDALRQYVALEFESPRSVRGPTRPQPDEPSDESVTPFGSRFATTKPTKYAPKGPKQPNLQSPFSAQSPFSVQKPDSHLFGCTSCVPRCGLCQRADERVSLFGNPPDSTPAWLKQRPKSPFSAAKIVPHVPVTPQPTQKGKCISGPIRACGGGTSYLIPPRRRYSKAYRSLNTPTPQESTSMSGCVAPEDEDASERLRARIGSDNNATVCDADYDSQLMYQPWRLVSKDELVDIIPWLDQTLAEDFLPENFYTTFNVVMLMLRSLEHEERSDVEVLESLMGFGSELHDGFVDVEYMRPCFPPEDWSEYQRKYWEALEEWKGQSLHDLGVVVFDDGECYTAGEEYFSSKGCTMELSGSSKKSSRW